MIPLSWEQEDTQALDAAWRLLSYRPRTVAELTERLLKKGFSPETIERVVEHLSELGELDDLAFARLWVAGREANKPMGRYRLRQELRSKGVDSVLVDSALEGYSNEKEFELARGAASKRYRVLLKTETDTSRQARKLRAWLERRGFAPAVVRKVSAEFQVQLDELDS